MRLVFLGPPGAGKGTQAEMLAKAEGLLHLSTGDLLRNAIARGTPTGLRAKGFVDGGRLVPDEVVDALVDERLKEEDAGGGYIFDGYPRNLSQAHELSRLLAERGSPLHAVVYLTVDDDVLVARIRGRAIESGRTDDSEEVVRERLRVYREHTEPLVAHYGAQGLLKRIDGDRTVDEVREAISAELAGVGA